MAGVPVESVPYWLVLLGRGGGVAHALHSTQSGWHYTLCGILTPNGALRVHPPRICRKCRLALRTARLTPEVS